MPTGLHLEASALSDAGRVRAANQDAWSYSAEGGVFVVCDGMGGAAGGEIASRIAAEAFVESLAGLLGKRRTAKAVEQAICKANRQVLARAAHEPALRGMGTTLIGLALQEGLVSPENAVIGTGESTGLADEPSGAIAGAGEASRANGRLRALLVHVGDSRAYLLRAGVLTCCTEDHSLVAEQLRLGVMTGEEAERSPMRHVITRSVGARATVAPEVQPISLAPGDLVLLCTDGLTRELPDAAIEILLRRGATLSLAERNRSLVDAALGAGGRDNITSLLVAIG